MLFMCVIYISLIAIGTGCKDDVQYYEGKVTSLNANGNGCYNIIQITRSISHGLPVNATINFGLNTFNRNLKIGETVHFDLINYSKWEGPATAQCLWPEYTGELKQHE